MKLVDSIKIHGRRRFVLYIRRVSAWAEDKAGPGPYLLGNLHVTKDFFLSVVVLDHQISLACRARWPTQSRQAGSTK